MSYIDGNSTSRNKALTGGVVALLQAGVAIALVNGFAVTLFAPDPPRHLPSQIFPTAPIPTQAVEPPKDRPDTPMAKDVVTTAPSTKLPIVPEFTIPHQEITTVLPTGGVFDGGEALFVKPLPSDPPPRFAPRTAKPRGNVAGWVTTEDYPTADIRAGHTGTVRFRLAIDASGRVTGCTIAQSSGHTGLDAATCRNVTKRARFDAASDAMGDKVAGSYDGTIRWVIPQD